MSVNKKELTYEIIWTCRQNCEHCSSRSNMWNTDICNINTLKSNIDKFDSFNYIRLSWWEPFLHPDILEIINYIHQKWKHLQILSSWTYLKEWLRDILPENIVKDLKWKVSKIIFSMYWYYNEHDKIVEPRNNDFWFSYWDNLMDSIEKCSEQNISVWIQSVLLNNNIENIEDIFKTISCINKAYKNKINNWEIKKVNLHFLRYIKQWRWAELWLEALKKDELKEVMEKIKEFASKYDVETSWSSNIEFASWCDCNNAKMVIQPNWNIISCSALKWSIWETNKKFACTPRL